MNVRDPFNLRRSPAFAILRGSATGFALNLSQQILDTGAWQAIQQSSKLVGDMSFSIPKNVPSFTDPQRELENRVWGSSGVTARSSAAYGAHQFGGGNTVQDRMGSFIGNSRELPMYKDKPFYAKSSRNRPLWRRKRTLVSVGLLFVFLLYLFGFFENSAASNKEEKGNYSWNWLQKPEKGKVNWLDRRERVVEAFKLSWDAYDTYAWGYDEFHPVSKTGRNMAPNGMGWIIVDALDTLMLMNLTTRLTHARDWISTKLDYDQSQDVNTFETTIRMIGGLLSAHYLSTTFPDMAPISEDDPGTAGEDLYLEKAKDLADRVIGAFESDSGIPFASVDLKTAKGIPSHDDGGASSTAEAGTLQLEFKYLAKLTGEKYYWDKAEKVMEVIDNNGMEDGLVPIYIYAPDGQFRGDNIRLGSRGDSYYEYLIKQYLQTSKQEPIYEDMWDQALHGVRKHLITYSTPTGYTVLGERQNGLQGDLTPKMDHLVCFMPGTIALAATGGLPEAEARMLKTWSKKKDEEMKLARELMQTCWGMYKAMATGLAGEITHFRIADPPLPESAPHQPPTEFDPDPNAAWRQDFMIKPGDRHSLQRPETVESLFYMWRITGEEKYRDYGWEMFKSFMNYTAVDLGGGFTTLRDASVVPPEKGDNMESFWLAETLKYFYLLFSPNDLLPLNEIVINTEAHAFPRFELGPLFKTGWKRKPRDENGKIVSYAQQSAPPKEKREVVETVLATRTAGEIEATPSAA